MGMGSALSDFLAAANRVADATQLRAMVVGAIWYEAERQVLLLLRGVLCPLSSPRVKDRFSTRRLGAARVLLQRSEWETFINELSGSRLVLGGGMDLDFSVSEEQQPSWRYLPKTYPAQMKGPAIAVAASGATFNEVLGPDRSGLDRQIAAASRYDTASFPRLAKRFVGQTLESRDSVELELIAPWPAQEVRSVREDQRIRLVVTGQEGLDVGRLVVNVESSGADRRLGQDELIWTTFRSSDGLPTCEATFEGADRTVTGVNVFVQGVEEVGLRTLVDASSVLDIVRPTRRRPAPHASETRAELRALHVEGYRCLRDAKVEVGDLKVLVGPNQAGKSTFLEALAIVRDAMAGSLYDALIRRRDAFRQLLWRSQSSGHMQFDAHLGLGGRELRFGFVLGAVGTGDYAVEREALYERRASAWHLLLSASKGVAEVDGLQVRTEDSHELMLPSLRSPEHGDTLRAVTAGLMSIAVYPGFETGALWADPDRARMRQASRIEPSARLDPLGGNLAAALYALSAERPHDWDDFLDVTRLVFPRLHEISFPPAEAGRIQIAWREEGSTAPFFGRELSDGTLHFLASLCALYQDASLIALDEPELHLHPEALYRLVSAAAKVADTTPVLLATQSDRLLGFLDETPDAVTILRRGPRGTEVVRPDAEQLADWLKQFSLSDLRHELESWGLTA